ncbi:GAF domain-containing protein [Nocardia cyriacigeorgica]|uniref:GAF domain-containing protein n=1 Tax=Nocardia cyriacigeorgica TaxID=135487 RepID=A0A6P1D2M0_9NOCA|nr:GAF domain-containing protein [Nocardia cyriacigeorgica]NEW39295.1 GAF domain-containing protein [Nocardia cyriacigeorgica]NEW43223.1 GAF domain-containing protein [Nocardia cyriacigeorgica]NEW49800.1 GAF domain-containing protein [Nocardia cyriacigeorgica]NEW54535.1 GAF domain-containing protein [Nocardia cyriacigeorgica]
MNDADGMRGTPRADRRSGGRGQRLRSDVRASWDRAQRRGLHPDRHLPQIAVGGAELAHHRAQGGLATVWPVLLSTLGSAADEPGHLLFAGDACGHLLWVLGDTTTRRAAERAHLVAGADWHEDAAGTNGVGTALALGKPFQVRGAEHYLSIAAGYTCSAAPIRDPATGTVVGVVDVTCRSRDAHPLALPLVTAAARLAEARLAEVGARRDAQLRARYLERVVRRSGAHVGLLTPDGRVVHAEPPGWLPRIWPDEPAEGPMILPNGRRIVLERLAPSGPFAVYGLRGGDPQARVTVLGRRFAQISVDGVSRQLGLRHSEIVVLLLAEPNGLSANELADAVYGASGKPGTIRAELTRLRSLLGYRLTANPYRLTDTTGDFLEPPASVRRLSTDHPRPSLLPDSQAPGIARLRMRLYPTS